MSSFAFPTSPSDSYERLGHRLQQLIESPHVQKRKYVEVRRSPAECEQDWSRLLESLESTDGVSVNQLETGAVGITWQHHTEF